ncbi:hypothetical protein VUR80DRAFT_9676 [Thermomyces stellatus]
MAVGFIQGNKKPIHLRPRTGRCPDGFSGWGSPNVSAHKHRPGGGSPASPELARGAHAQPGEGSSYPVCKHENLPNVKVIKCCPIWAGGLLAGLRDLLFGGSFAPIAVLFALMTGPLSADLLRRLGHVAQAHVHGKRRRRTSSDSRHGANPRR